jgi:hypothetical protein
MLPDEKKKEATEELQKLVACFNQDLEIWNSKFGCVASFGWRYGKEEKRKLLEVTGVDMIIWRKPPPPAETLRAMVEKHEQTQHAPDEQPAN